MGFNPLRPSPPFPPPVHGGGRGGRGGRGRRGGRGAVGTRRSGLAIVNLSSKSTFRSSPMYSLNVAVRSVVCIDRKTKTFSEARSSRRRLLLLLLLLLVSPYPFWLKLPNASHRRGSLVDIRPDDGHEIWLNGHETCAAVPPATSRAASQRSFYKHLQHSALMRVQPYYVSHGSCSI